jgi:hypothetical protein
MSHERRKVLVSGGVPQLHGGWQGPAPVFARNEFEFRHDPVPVGSRTLLLPGRDASCHWPGSGSQRPGHFYPRCARVVHAAPRLALRRVGRLGCSHARPGRFLNLSRAVTRRGCAKTLRIKASFPEPVSQFPHSQRPSLESRSNDRNRDIRKVVNVQQVVGEIRNV